MALFFLFFPFLLLGVFPHNPKCTLGPVSERTTDQFTIKKNRIHPGFFSAYRACRTLDQASFFGNYATLNVLMVVEVNELVIEDPHLP